MRQFQEEAVFKGMMWKEKGAGLLVVLVLGVLYYVWLKLTGLAIPCMFYIITGWKCPGCGITTLFLCVAKLDFYGAYQANPFLFFTGIPLVLLLLFGREIVQKFRIPTWFQKTVAVVYLAALLLFGIIRNFV